MHVDELREAGAGVWFPAKITVVDSTTGNHTGKPVVISRTETTVDEVNLAPHHEAAFFRDVAIPADLPVFTIKDRRLVGSMLPEPFDDDWGRKKLAELAARVAEQEKRYDDIEVKARVRQRAIPTHPGSTRTSGSTRCRRNARSSGAPGLLTTHRAGSPARTAGRTRASRSMPTTAGGRGASWSGPQNPRADSGDPAQGDRGERRRPRREAISVSSAAHAGPAHTWWIFSTLADLLASPRYRSRSGSYAPVPLLRRGGGRRPPLHRGPRR